MNNALTKWTMKLGRGGVEYPAHPIYKDDMALNYELETGQMFFRSKLSGKLTIVREDAERVFNAPFDTEFLLLLYISFDQGVTWSLYHTSKFYKTDCTINYADKKVVINPQVTDQYDKVLAGMEREYDLVKLAPPLEQVVVTKRSMSEIYREGDNKVTCVYGGQYFELDSNYDNGTAAQILGFYHSPQKREFKVHSDLTGLQEPFLGDDATGEFRNTEEIYVIKKRNEQTQPYEIDGVLYITRLTIVEIYADDGSTNALWQWLAQLQIPEAEAEDYGYPPIPETLTLTSTTSLPDVTASTVSIDFYWRIITDLAAFPDGQGGIIYCAPLPADDFVDNPTPRYKYYATGQSYVIVPSWRYSETPTEWGQDTQGRYFLPPDDENVWIPIGQSSWVDISLWVNGNEEYPWMPNSYRQIIQSNCYPLHGVIQALLNEIDPDVKFEKDAAYSHVLYGNEVLLPFEGDIYLTPKSNILVGEYSVPAQKAPCTLKTILDMLKNVFKMYWYIDSDKKMHIEHIFFFKNGGSYTSEPTVGYDLTQMKNLNNGKLWSFNTSEYSFDKEDMAERYQFKWMDDCSKVFEGLPIDIVSPFTREGKTEETNVANISSDLDLMFLRPDQFSNDGFALLLADKSNTTPKVVPFHDVEMNGLTYNVQNPYACFAYIIPFYWVYDLPSWEAKCGDVALTVEGIQYNKKQTVRFPMGYAIPDTNKLVKTEIGNGAFDKIAFTISSASGKIQLKYPTYDAEQ